MIHERSRLLLHSDNAFLMSMNNQTTLSLRVLIGVLLKSFSKHVAISSFSKNRNSEIAFLLVDLVASRSMPYTI